MKLWKSVGIVAVTIIALTILTFLVSQVRVRGGSNMDAYDTRVILEGPATWLVHGGYLKAEEAEELVLPSVSRDGEAEVEVTVVSDPTNITPIPEEWPLVLNAKEMLLVLKLAGWPDELLTEALTTSSCESGWHRRAIGDNGAARGLFQVHLSPWFSYTNEDPELWDDPVVNARVAWKVYQYDLEQGYSPWTQWAARCRP